MCCFFFKYLTIYFSINIVGVSLCINKFKIPCALFENKSILNAIKKKEILPNSSFFNNYDVVTNKNKKSVLFVKNIFFENFFFCIIFCYYFV